MSFLTLRGRIPPEWWVGLKRNQGSDNFGMGGRNGPEYAKALFNDPKLGGASGKSCNSCHADGSGLETAGGKKEFKIMGKTVASIEAAVNICIERRMKGKALNPKSADMANLTAYIKSLKGKASILAPKKRTAATGC